MNRLTRHIFAAVIGLVFAGLPGIALLAQLSPSSPFFTASLLKPAAGGGGGVVATDNFDSYANFAQLDLEANWVNVSADQWYVYKPASDGVAYCAISTSERCIRNTATVNANHYSSATLVIASGSASIGIGPAVRCQSGSDSWYSAYWFGAGSTLYILKCNSGTVSVVTSTAKSYSTGAKLKIEATGTGSATRLSVYEDTGGGWSAVFTSQDPGGTYLDGGFTGMAGYGIATDIALDNWECGNL